jgi:uncharacterized FAD-dependent dehydrogenase
MSEVVEIFGSGLLSATHAGGCHKRRGRICYNDGVADRYRVENLELPVGGDERALVPLAAQALGVEPASIVEWHVTRRSLDARRHRARFSFHVEVTLAAGIRPAGKPPAGVRVEPARDEPVPVLARPKAPPENPVVVIGAGPGGLFAAKRLREGGVPCVVLERGTPVRKRVIDVAKLWRSGILDPESNPLFGEGGAGTFSDGKLYTRTRDPRIRMVWETFVDYGAQPEILVDAHPHIGTNRLRTVIPNMREDLERQGVEVRFRTRVEGFRVEGGRVTGVELADGTTIRTQHVILAIGHSARDTYHALHDAGVTLLPMPFAIGVRIEHSQEMIDTLQLGDAAGDKRVGAASYRLSKTLPPEQGGRAAWSFCMCPGGVIVASMHEPGTVVTNGMSASGRPGRKANAGLVVGVTPEDYAAKKGTPAGPFDGIAFQKRYEEAAYAVGGGGFVAPAQRASDFVKNRPTENPLETSYLPGVRPGDVSKCLPRFVSTALRRALVAFDRTMPGFAGDEGVLVGVESRVSAPVRIPRDDRGEAIGTRGLFPVGEGAGYAGGITSAAVDGMRAAEAVLEDLARVGAPL